MNKKSMTFLVRLLIFTIILGILAFTAIFLVSTNQVEGVSNFFTDRFLKIVNVNIWRNVPKI